MAAWANSSCSAWRGTLGYLTEKLRLLQLPGSNIGSASQLPLQLLIEDILVEALSTQRTAHCRIRAYPSDLAEKLGLLRLFSAARLSASDLAL